MAAGSLRSATGNLVATVRATERSCSFISEVLSMATKPLYVVFVFNIYSDEPAFPGESPEDQLKRKRTYHYAAFSPDDAVQMAESRFHKSCAHNWMEPTLAGEFPTKFDRTG